MFLSKDKAQSFTIPGGTTGVLFPPSPKGDQSVAVIEMNGVYPAQGYSRNDYCTETIYMVEGQFEVEYDGQWYTLNPGDLIMLLPNKKYRTKGNGKACVFISPAWDSKQNHIIKE